jgi:hypothetical protein
MAEKTPYQVARETRDTARNRIAGLIQTMNRLQAELDTWRLAAGEMDDIVDAFDREHREAAEALVG